MQQQVTVLGQGAMGSRMADRLEASGFAVIRWNRSSSEIAPSEAVQGSQLVLAMLRDDEASRAVWLDPEKGALSGMKQASAAIESSTLTPDCMREIGDAASARDIAFLEAPVLGSRPQAEAGALVHLLGGEADVVQCALPLLEAVGAKQVHAGKVGAGASLKLIANTLFAAQVALMAELIGRAPSLSLDPAEMVEMLAQTPLLSSAAGGAAGLMLAGKDDPMFPVHLVRKDLNYALDEMRASMPIAAAAETVFATAIDTGLGEANLTAVHQLYR